MRILYSFLLSVLSPLFILRLWIKSRKTPAYFQRVSERFGLFKKPEVPIDIWIHAVSLGEVNACLPLIGKLLEQEKVPSIAITTMTPTGSQRVKQVYGDKVFHVYLPYDLPMAVNSFLSKLNPKVAVILETEIWPNLITLCHRRGIPMVVANARLSPHSFKGYQRIHCLLKPYLRKLRFVFAQSEEDGQRFLQIGVNQDQLRILGNIKFDIKPSSIDNTVAQAMKNAWGSHRPVVIAASTHENEEQQVLQAFKPLKKQREDILLLIAPRHPERFDAVENLCQQSDYRVVRRTNAQDIEPQTEIVIIDSIGELMAFYSVADVVYVGGSLVPVGGHNVLEPISLGLPVIVGPHMFNFNSITKQLKEANGIIQVEDADSLGKAFLSLLNDEQMKKKLIENSSACLKNNQGVIAGYIKEINLLL